VQFDLDDNEFSTTIDRHRREIHLHCYRMLGSFEEAEDLTQDVLLKAWQARAGFEQRATVRTWLYRIATNACFDALRRRRRMPSAAGNATVADLSFLQPYADSLIEEGCSADEQLLTNETIDLALLVAMQLLSHRQRAIFILRDLLQWRADETARQLGMTVVAVNSSLQRARRALRCTWSPVGSFVPATTSMSPVEQTLLDRYIDAYHRHDFDAIVALLHEDVRMAAPGHGQRVGKAAVSQVLRNGLQAFEDWRFAALRANGRPALASYVRRPGHREFIPFAVTLFTIEEREIVTIDSFLTPQLFVSFGLPAGTSGALCAV
jgi:RNA polymerase sigma-70 factor (ECF subfamily)